MACALDRLLSPTPYEQFATHYWSQDCLLNKGSSSRFADLFEWASIEKILSTQRFDFPRLRLVRRGKVVPSHEYMAVRHDRRGTAYVTHVSQAVLREMQQGAMLHITAVNDAWEPLARFAAALELELTARVQVNLHAALARSKGFATHWDGHDVFVIQVAGKKAWRLFGFTEVAPLAVPPDQKRDPPKHLLREIVLEAGDMLYVPRGYWHAAEALDDISLHLTFAAQHPTGLEFLSWLTRQLETEAGLRQDVPFCRGAVSDTPIVRDEQYVAEMKSILDRKLQPSTVKQFLQEYRAGLGSTNHVQLDGDSNADSRNSPEAHCGTRSGAYQVQARRQ
jgi:ribosomal protein L16 Arg81 hydroxylase